MPPFFYLLLLCLAFLGGCIQSRTLLVTDTVHGEQRWQGTILIDGDVTLASDAVVHVAPGTEILFLPPSTHRDRFTTHPHFPGSELIVQGRLLAEGNALQPIVFAYVDTAAPPASWGGINLVESPEARFRYCRFTQADSALHSQKSSVVVEDSRFEKNLVAIRFHASKIRIEHNLLRDNATALRFHYGAPVIRYNELQENDKALFISAEPHDYLIEANNIVGTRGDLVVLGEEVTNDVVLSGNWWGTNDLTSIGDRLFDARRVDYLGRVLLEPLALAPLPTAGIR